MCFIDFYSSSVNWNVLLISFQVVRSGCSLQPAGPALLALEGVPYEGHWGQ